MDSLELDHMLTQIALTAKGLAKKGPVSCEAGQRQLGLRKKLCYCTHTQSVSDVEGR